MSLPWTHGRQVIHNRDGEDEDSIKLPKSEGEHLHD